MAKRRKRNRNPVAQFLNINKPKVIPDKRTKIKEKLADQEVKDANRDKSS